MKQESGAEKGGRAESPAPAFSVEVSHVSKRYGAVRALTDVSLTLQPGLTAIVGDNGAGKTTLMKVLAGVTEPTDGVIKINGVETRLPTPVAARMAGIEALYQDLALADTLSVSDNIFLGRELTRRRLGIRMLDKRKMIRDAERVISDLRVGIPSGREIVRDMSGGQRQAVALGRAIYFNAQTLLLDEPTAALGPRETKTFMDLIAAMVARGKTVAMVAHNLPMAIDIASWVVVMRAGSVMARMNAREVTAAEVNALIVGETEAPAKPTTPGVTEL